MARGFRGGAFRPLLAAGLLLAALGVVPATPASADWLDPERPLTGKGTVPQGPQLSGTLVAYSDHATERTVDGSVTVFDVRVHDLVTGTDRLLTPGHTATGRAAISGKRVVWSDAGDGAARGIWYADLASGERRRLPTRAGENVAISGTRLCYEYRGRIWTYDVRAGRERALSPATAHAADCDISGSVVVWQDDRNGHDLDVWAADLRSGVETRVAGASGDQSMPRVDGDLVVWQDGRHGATESDVYAADLATGIETPVSVAEGRQWAPDVSDRQVVWMDERFGHDNTEIMVLDLASGIETRVTASDGWSGNPTIAGGRIVYEDVRGDGHNLYSRTVTRPDLTLAVNPDVDRPGLGGHLLGSGGVPVVGATVRLQLSTDGRAWLDAGSALTSGDGSYLLPAMDGSGTRWLRASFAGSPEYAPAVSTPVQAGLR